MKNNISKTNKQKKKSDIGLYFCSSHLNFGLIKPGFSSFILLQLHILGGLW